MYGKEKLSISKIIDQLDDDWYYEEWQKCVSEYNKEPNPTTKYHRNHAKKEYKEIEEVCRSFKSEFLELERLIGEEFRLEEFFSAVYDCELIYSRKIDRLFHSEFNVLRREKNKISKNLYKKYKKYKFKYIAFDNDRHRYISLGAICEENYKTISGKHSFSDYLFEEIRLKTEKERLRAYQRKEDAIKAKPGFNNLTIVGKNALSRLNTFKFFKDRDKLRVFCNFTKLEEQYNQIINLSKQIFYIKNVLKENWLFNDTKVYKEITKEIEKQEEKLRVMFSKAEELYNKLDLENIKKLVEELESLNLDIIHYSDVEEKLILNGKHEEARKVHEKIFETRVKMEKIINENPKLKKIKSQFSGLEEKTKTRTNRFLSNDKMSSQTKETKTVVTQATKEESSNKDEIVNLQETSMDLLSKYRKMYIEETIRETELGKMNFSEYLKKVAPKEKKLIGHVIMREERVRTIYAEYIKEMVKRQKNKETYITFKTFLEQKYKIQDYSSLDIPVDIKKRLK